MVHIINIKNSQDIELAEIEFVPVIGHQICLEESCSIDGGYNILVEGTICKVEHTMLVHNQNDGTLQSPTVTTIYVW